VHQRRGFDRLHHPLVARADFAGEGDRITLDALGVQVRRLVAGRHRARQRFNHHDRAGPGRHPPDIRTFG
jgi:hypothetical protein